jgi:hypothetical protein
MRSVDEIGRLREILKQVSLPFPLFVCFVGEINYE